MGLKQAQKQSLRKPNVSGLPLYSSKGKAENIDKDCWFDCQNDCKVDKVVWIDGDAYCSECGEEGTVYQNRNIINL